MTVSPTASGASIGGGLGRGAAFGLGGAALVGVLLPTEEPLSSSVSAASTELGFFGFGMDGAVFLPGIDGAPPFGFDAVLPGMLGAFLPGTDGAPLFFGTDGDPPFFPGMLGAFFPGMLGAFLGTLGDFGGGLGFA